MALKVIGVGKGRTGTVSLKLALERLGFGPCYHMSELMRNPTHWPSWERAFEEQPINWEDIYKDYLAAVDTPTDVFCRELAAFYPKAKLILTVRDPESWYRSVSATVWSEEVQSRLRGGPAAGVMMKLVAYYTKHTGLQLGSGKMPTREQAIADFIRHNEAVQREFPPERLLVYKANQGWEPLCRFLSVPVPDAPFPRANTTEEFQQRMRNLQSQKSPG